MRLKYHLPQESFKLKIPTSLERCTVKDKMPKNSIQSGKR